MGGYSVFFHFPGCGLVVGFCLLVPGCGGFACLFVLVVPVCGRFGCLLGVPVFGLMPILPSFRGGTVRFSSFLGGFFWLLVY